MKKEQAAGASPERIAALRLANDYVQRKRRISALECRNADLEDSWRTVAGLAWLKSLVHGNSHSEEYADNVTEIGRLEGEMSQIKSAYNLLGLNAEQFDAEVWDGLERPQRICGSGLDTAARYVDTHTQREVGLTSTGDEAFIAPLAGLGKLIAREAGAAAAAKATEAVNVLPSSGSKFVISRGGDVIIVPKGAVGPSAVINPKGKTTGVGYTGGSGGPGIDPRVSNVRIMNPTPPKGASPGYPEGYVTYENSGGQAVNPFTGKTISDSDPLRHIPLTSP